MGIKGFRLVEKETTGAVAASESDGRKTFFPRGVVPLSLRFPEFGTAYVDVTHPITVTFTGRWLLGAAFLGPNDWPFVVTGDLGLGKITEGMDQGYSYFVEPGLSLFTVIPGGIIRGGIGRSVHTHHRSAGVAIDGEFYLLLPIPLPLLKSPAILSVQYGKWFGDDQPGKRFGFALSVLLGGDHD